MKRTSGQVIRIIFQEAVRPGRYGLDHAFMEQERERLENRATARVN
jgi:hypothetical protein